jgi:hypothetical protein
MQVAHLACIVRFKVFPFVPDEQKRPTIRRLFEMDVGHSAFQKALEPLLQTEQFVRFAKTVGLFYKSKEFHKPLHPSLDLEIVEQLFWEEEDETIAKALLTGLLGVSWNVHISMWTAAVNLWLSARNLEDKQAILYMLRNMYEGN